MVDDVMSSPERIQARSTWSKECTSPIGLDVDESADTKQAAWSRSILWGAPRTAIPPTHTIAWEPRRVITYTREDEVSNHCPGNF